ncbi:DUF1802 family protein, partial [Mycobacterium avium]|uniref:DUF1802 family protein n=1 Tax=Mycobacterium avium TaxID=1764 RepID=UPI001E3F5292
PAVQPRPPPRLCRRHPPRGSRERRGPRVRRGRHGARPHPARPRAPAAASGAARGSPRPPSSRSGAVQPRRPAGLPAIEDLHIWTAESVRADRLDFRPKHKLAVLVVSVTPLAEPVRLARTPDYAGCKSWVQLPVHARLGPPVHDDETLAAVADRVRDAVG